VYGHAVRLRGIAHQRLRCDRDQLTPLRIQFNATLKATGKINDEQAKLHIEIQKNATRTVLLTVEGLGIVTVDAAINAALDAVKDSVNTAVGFVLI
jgi:hypothetical protein